MKWLTALQTESWTAVTGAEAHAAQIHHLTGNRMRPQDRLSSATGPTLTSSRGEHFDIVLADYSLGAVEGFAPYFRLSCSRGCAR